MTDTHPYATRSRIRNAVNAKIVESSVAPKKIKGKKIPLQNGDSEKARINNEKKEEVEDDGQGEIKRVEEVVGEVSIEQEKKIPCVKLAKLEESRIEEEIEEKLMIEKEKRKHLKAEEEKICLELQLEEERRERLLLEQLRLEQIHAEEENREKLRIEQEKLEQLRKENQLIKEKLEKQKLEVEQWCQQKPPTPTVFDRDMGINSNCLPPQETILNDGLTNIKQEMLTSEKIIASATQKALKQFQEKKRNSNQKWKKTIRTPSSIRRKWRNNRLNRLLVPKSGLNFLHELKPGCTYSIREEKEYNCTRFEATVEYEGEVIAVGQGSSKMLAKKAAAENAIKILVTSIFKKNSNQEFKNTAGGLTNLGLSEISWTGLASYAMYKMFSDWQTQGSDFSYENYIVEMKPKYRNWQPVPVKKNLPPNANKLHPGYVLNLMVPGLGPAELERTQNNNVTSMTVGYNINGKMYTGTATSKKKAKLTAAKAVLTALYGVKYED